MRHVMAPPNHREHPPARGLMAPDPTASAHPVSLSAVLWVIAGVLALAELVASSSP
jgi:hypothetical protein